MIEDKRLKVMFILNKDERLKLMFILNKNEKNIMEVDEPSSSEVQNEQQQLQQPVKRRFHCNLDNCGKAFSQKRSLVEHCRTHTGVRPYSCIHCTKTFHRLPSFRRHIRHHNDERPYSCDYGNCDKRFKEKYDLSAHKITHTDERNYICLCGKSYKSKYRLKIHQSQKKCKQTL